MVRRAANENHCRHPQMPKPSAAAASRVPHDASWTSLRARSAEHLEISVASARALFVAGDPVPAALDQLSLGRSPVVSAVGQRQAAHPVIEMEQVGVVLRRAQAGEACREGHRSGPCAGQRKRVLGRRGSWRLGGKHDDQGCSMTNGICKPKFA